MNITIKLDEDLIEDMKVYAEAEGKTQVDFMNEIFADALTSYRVKKSGGAVFTVPNPQFYHITEADAKKAVEDCMNLAIKLSNKNIHVGLGATANFLETRFFVDTPDLREKFQSNAKIYS
ncbi:MAG: hypothetical protein J6L69_08380 [Lachnospiraceae bacterium]|nr:hypothetical protein [Lachnospiraceae bacterium]